MDVNLNSSIKFGGFGTYGLWASEISFIFFSLLHKKSNIVVVSVLIGHDGQQNSYNGTITYNQHSYVRTTQINRYELLHDIIYLLELWITLSETFVTLRAAYCDAMVRLIAYDKLCTLFSTYSYA